MEPLKDDLLSRLAARANVAQFVSFGPAGDLPQRRSCLRGHRPDHRFGGAEEAVDALLALAQAARSTSGASRRARPRAARSATA